MGEPRYYDWNAAIEFYSEMFVYRHKLNCDCGLRSIYTTSDKPLKYCPNCGRRVEVKS